MSFVLLIRFLFTVGGNTGFMSGLLRPTNRCFGLRLSTDDDRGPGNENMQIKIKLRNEILYKV